MANYINSQSTVTIQRIVNIAKGFGDIEPILNVAGSSIEMPLAIANDVANAIFSVNFDWKFNEMAIPPFYTNSYQQDYAITYPGTGIGPNSPWGNGGPSITKLGWLVRGIVVDINNTAQPKPYRLVEVGRQLPQGTGTFWNSATNNPMFLVNYFQNHTLYYGTWGDANVGNDTLGNNPVAGSVYTNPLGLANGQAQSMPANPITQIQDANGNFLVLTTYGVEGTAAPLAPANSAAGTTVSGLNATTIWTVVDPYGQGFRILPIPSQTGVVWQFLLYGQVQPVRYTSLQQTLFPIPDYLEPNFRQMFVAQCYRYSPDAKIRGKFKDEWALAMQALNECRSKEDRELEENMFTPERSIMGGGMNRNNQWAGAGYPFNYPGWGW